MHVLARAELLYPLCSEIPCIWVFHSILVTWFFVIFGNEVTKVLSNSLLTFFTEQGKTGKTEIQSKENQQDNKKTRSEVTKICIEPGKVSIA